VTDTGKARLVTSVAEIGAARWNGFANPHGVERPHPFTTYAFFHALEASGSATAQTGWQPCHLLIEGKGLMPLYLKSHSFGEYVFDQGWAEALEGAGGDYYPKLQNAVPFTPVTGPRLLATDDDSRRLLLQTAAGALTQLRASSLHITFPTEHEWRLAGDNGCLLREGRQFHWKNQGYQNFAQFLGELSSAKRKNLRKERARVHAEGICFDWLTGSDLTEAHWDQFFTFYMDTGARKWGTPYLTREFFSRLGEGMADQVLLIMARRGDTYIAGALNLFGENVLFGRNWGATEYVPFLHFETCYYQAIEFAIAHGLKRVEAGAQGEHKLLRGYMPVPTFSAHLIVHPGLRRAVDHFLAAEREAVREDIAELAAHGPYRKGA
jgi:predicted N-acyltransferase